MSEEKKDEMSADPGDAKESAPGVQIGGDSPPVDHKFKKGKSPNPRGRPKKRERAWSQGQLFADIFQEANREVTVTANGKSTKTTVQQLIVRRFFTEVAARGGSLAAMRAIEMIQTAAVGRAKLNRKLYSFVEGAEESTFSSGHYPPSANIIDFLDYWKKRTRDV